MQAVLGQLAAAKAGQLALRRPTLADVLTYVAADAISIAAEKDAIVAKPPPPVRAARPQLLAQPPAPGTSGKPRRSGLVPQTAWPQTSTPSGLIVMLDSSLKYGVVALIA